MTGVDPEEAVILEIASVITNGDLELVAEGPNIAIHQPEESLMAMEQWLSEQHTASGLLDRVRASTYDCQMAAEKTLQFLFAYCRKGQSPLCGNSVWQDRRFLAKYMPPLYAFLHHRDIDVSSIKELVRRWYPSLPPFKKQGAHLAAIDIKESVGELKYYRDKVFLSKGKI
jgi:oligoribonuclease